MKEITVKINNNNFNNFNIRHRKIKITTAYIAIDKNFKKILECRIYSTKKTAYACIWTYAEGYRQGSASSTVYGYNRINDSVWKAIKNTGFEISGITAGEADIPEKALTAIAKKISGKRKIKTIKVNA